MPNEGIDEVVFNGIARKLKNINENFETKDYIKYGIYTLYFCLFIVFMVIYGYLATIAISLSKARQLGKRYQEECGNVYMEAETARYQIYTAYNGDIATQLNQIKNVIFSIAVVVISILFGIMGGTLFKDFWGKELFGKTIWMKIILPIIAVLFIGSISTMAALYGEFKANKDYRDNDPNTSIGTKKENADKVLKAIDGTFVSVIAVGLIVTIGFTAYIMNTSNDNSMFNNYKAHYYILLLIIGILYIVLRLYIRMVDNLNSDIYFGYSEKLTELKSTVRNILSQRSAVNYLQNNLQRLNPGSTEKITLGSDPNKYYQLIEHRLGKEQTTYYSDPTVPRKIKAADINGLIQKYATDANAKSLMTALKTKITQTDSEYDIKSIKDNISLNNGIYMFNITEAVPIGTHSKVGADILDVLYTNYTVLKPYNEDENIIALFSEQDIKEAVQSVKISSISSDLLDENGKLKLNDTRLKNVFNSTTSTDSSGNPVGPTVTININSTNTLRNITLKNVYLAFNQMKNNINFNKDIADEIIRQMKLYLLYLLVKSDDSNTARDKIRDQMAALRDVKFVETSTDDFTRLIAYGTILPIIIICGIVYNKIYKAQPSITTIGVIIVIFLAIFIITWYAWFAGNLLL